MKPTSTRQRRMLTFTQTLIVCGVIFALYKIFRTPELDHEIEKFADKYRQTSL
jgi:hypothetical protein